MEQLKKLTDLLITGEFLTVEQLEEAREIAKKTGKSLNTILVEKDFITDEHLGKLFADINKWAFVNLKKEGIDESILKLIPEKVAKKQKVIAFTKTPSGIKIAMNNPEDTTLLHLLKKRLNNTLIPFYATENDISDHFNLYKIDVKEEFEKIIKAEAEQAIKAGKSESSTIQIVDMLLRRGYENVASDIHIEPYEDSTIIRFRIDGVMHDIISVPNTIHNLLISRIKVMAKLRTDEHQSPQDGKLQHKIGDERADVRVSIVPTTKGENAVMRLLSEKSRQFTLEELGLSEKDYKKLADAIKKPWGMVLSTGPTGCGKTTTLYSILKILNKKEVNIATIEDPVEFNIDGITQIQVNPRAKLTFASGLRSIVRQDPDIIMVGEIRDAETAGIATNSAMTGHLVLSTLHTNDAATTLPRLLDMDIEPFLIASTVNIAIGQRLIRKICPKCIMSYEIQMNELREKVPIDTLEKLTRGKDIIRLYKGKGCPLCNNTGYMGRTGVFELMEINDDIRKLIMENADADEIKKKAIENGMTTMFDDAREKVLNGVTTIEEMLRVVKE